MGGRGHSHLSSSSPSPSGLAHRDGKALTHPLPAIASLSAPKKSWGGEGTKKGRKPKVTLSPLLLNLGCQSSCLSLLSLSGSITLSHCDVVFYYMTISLYPFSCWWLLGQFQILSIWIFLLWTFQCVYFGKNIYLSVGYIYLGMEFLSHRVYIWAAVVDTNSFLKWFIFPQGLCESYCFSASLPCQSVSF